MLLNERRTIKKLFAERDFMPLNNQDDADTGVMFYYNPWNPSKLQYNFYFILVWVHRFVSKIYYFSNISGVIDVFFVDFPGHVLKAPFVSWIT